MKNSTLFLFVLSILCCCSAAAFSQDSAGDSVARERSAIRSMPDQEYLDYKYGREMGMAAVAELNNYPAPELVQKLEKQLKLTDVQRAELAKIIAAREFKAREMGGFILTQESRLNALFEAGKATDGSVIYYTNKIGLYLGELRNAHLQAHLKTRNLLTREQVRMYYQIKAATK